VLRVRIKKAEVETLQQECDIMIDQIRAIDNKRLTRKIAVLPKDLIEKVKENIAILLDFI
jgi:mRNA interferase MazF